MTFVHPTAVGGAPVVARLSQSMLEFPFDTTRTIASLLFGGVMTTFRAVRFIFSHAGGAMPYLAQRVEQLSQNAPELRERLPEGIVAQLGRYYYDTALSANASAFGSLLELVPVEQVLFGTDFPYGPKNQIGQTIEGLQALDLTAEQLQRIESENALALLPRLKRP